MAARQEEAVCDRLERLRQWKEQKAKQKATQAKNKPQPNVNLPLQPKAAPNVARVSVAIPPQKKATPTVPLNLQIELKKIKAAPGGPAEVRKRYIALLKDPKFSGLEKSAFYWIDRAQWEEKNDKTKSKALECYFTAGENDAQPSLVLLHAIQTFISSIHNTAESSVLLQSTNSNALTSSQKIKMTLKLLSDSMKQSPKSSKVLTKGLSTGSIASNSDQSLNNSAALLLMTSPSTAVPMTEAEASEISKLLDDDANTTLQLPDISVVEPLEAPSILMEDTITTHPFPMIDPMSMAVIAPVNSTTKLAYSALATPSKVTSSTPIKSTPARDFGTPVRAFTSTPNFNSPRRVPLSQHFEDEEEEHEEHHDEQDLTTEVTTEVTQEREEPESQEPIANTRYFPRTPPSMRVAPKRVPFDNAIISPVQTDEAQTHEESEQEAPEEQEEHEERVTEVVEQPHVIDQPELSSPLPVVPEHEEDNHFLNYFDEFSEKLETPKEKSRKGRKSVATPKSRASILNVVPESEEALGRFDTFVVVDEKGKRAVHFNQQTPVRKSTRTPRQIRGTPFPVSRKSDLISPVRITPVRRSARLHSNLGLTPNTPVLFTPNKYLNSSSVEKYLN